MWEPTVRFVAEYYQKKGFVDETTKLKEMQIPANRPQHQLQHPLHLHRCKGPLTAASLNRHGVVVLVFKLGVDSTLEIYRSDSRFYHCLTYVLAHYEADQLPTCGHKLCSWNLEARPAPQLYQKPILLGSMGSTIRSDTHIHSRLRFTGTISFQWFKPTHNNVNLSTSGLIAGSMSISIPQTNLWSFQLLEDD
jgi:hypothetical protein